jgi:hypothetical protein
MKCFDSYDLVGYVNNEVSDTEKVEIEQHLVSCFDCQKELDDIRGSIVSLRNLPEIEPSSDFTRNVIDRVRKEYTASDLVTSKYETFGWVDVIKYYLKRSPPWAVSTALHIVIFTVLAFVFVNQTSKSLSPYVGNRWTSIYLPKESNIEKHETQVHGSASLNVPEFILNQKELAIKIKQGNDNMVRDIINRVDEVNRKELLSKYNGTETVQAVSHGMKWLAHSQEDAGNWVPSAYGGNDEYTIAITGLSILCFTGQGNSHLKGDFSSTVNKSIKYLISVQEPNGLLSTSAMTSKPVNYMYNHGIGTCALLEDYLIVSNYPENEKDELTKKLSESVVKAVLFIVHAQSDNGGWGYTSRSATPDTSVTVWQIQVLRLASIMDIPGVEHALYKSRQWLCDVTSDNGFVGYQSLLDYPNGPYALTAAGSVANLWMDSLPITKSDKENDEIKKRLNVLYKKQVVLLTENLPESGETAIENDFYYCYWGSMMMISPNNPGWEKWNAKIKEILMNHQSDAGDWQVNDKWGVFGGNLYITTIAILNLQVYYRYPSMGIRAS